MRILNKIGVPRVTEGLPFSFSTPTANQVLGEQKSPLILKVLILNHLTYEGEVGEVDS